MKEKIGLLCKKERWFGLHVNLSKSNSSCSAVNSSISEKEGGDQQEDQSGSASAIENILQAELNQTKKALAFRNEKLIEKDLLITSHKENNERIIGINKELQIANDNLKLKYNELVESNTKLWSDNMVYEEKVKGYDLQQSGLVDTVEELKAAQDVIKELTIQNNKLKEDKEELKIKNQNLEAFNASSISISEDIKVDSKEKKRIRSTMNSSFDKDKEQQQITKTPNTRSKKQKI